VHSNSVGVCSGGFLPSVKILVFLHLYLLCFDFHLLVLDVQAKVGVNTHVNWRPIVNTELWMHRTRKVLGKTSGSSICE
jgi:hypothetical protein